MSTTKLRLEPLDGSTPLDISFNSHIGFEVNNKKANYIETNEEIFGTVQGKSAKQVTKVQELTPCIEGQFPSYKAINCNNQS